MSVLNAVLAFLAVLGGIASTLQLRIWLRQWQESRIDQFASIERHGIRLLQRIKASGFRPDFVLGLGRSGAFVGGWLAGNLGSVPIEVIDRFHRGQSTEPMEFPHLHERLALLRKIHGDNAKVLVVEGATTRGGTFHHFQLLRQPIVPLWDCKFSVLYEVDTVDFHTDFVAKVLPKAPARYPWHKTAEYRDFIRKTQDITIP